MRILQVGYGWPPQQGGGPVFNARNLAYEYARRGHEVFVFVIGEHSFLRPGCHMRVTCEGGAIEVARLINAPNSPCSVTDPLADVCEPVTDAFLRRHISSCRPDVIHFHNLVGFPISVLRAPEAAQVPFVVSLHNYWLICQRTTLYKSEGGICDGPQPMKCARCRYQELAKGSRERVLAYFRDPAVRIFKSQSPLRRRLRSIYHRAVGQGPTDATKEGKLASAPAPNGLESLAHRFEVRTVALGKLVASCAAHFHAPSVFVKERFVASGVPSHRIRVVHPDVSAWAVIGRKGKPPLPHKHNGYVTFGFFQGFLPEKGVEVAVQAFSRLRVPEAKLLLFGCDAHHPRAERIRRAFELSSQIGFGGTYGVDDLLDVCAQIDVAVIPPVWFDNAPQVVLEALMAGRPVIGSRIGGIPDFVMNGVNGFLFEAGNSQELASRLSWFCENPDQIEAMACRIVPPKTTPEHATEMLGWYRELVSQGR